jgi:hypothetical protein
LLCSVKDIAKLYSSLLDKVKSETLSISPSLVKNLLLVGCAIMVKETVNLNKIKNQIGPLLSNQKTLADSHYRRLTRFFNQPVAKRHLWKWIMIWVLAYIRRWDGRSMSLFLTLDATCWELGGVKIQLLVLSVVYRHISLPLCWVDLAKKGHSNQQERKRLLQMASKLYPLKGFCVLADREYVGRDWFAFLEDLDLLFIIRLARQDYKHEISQSGKSYGSLLKRALGGKLVGQQVVIGERNQQCQFVATCHQQGAESADPLVLLLTNSRWSKQKVVERYRIRWCTECLFKHLKTNGFDLEALGFQNRQKIRLLVAIVVVLYVICVAEGLKHFDRIGTKRYKNGLVTQRMSVFRYGYAVVSNYLATIDLFIEWLLRTILQKVKVPKPAI